ncbi:hypothetical protein M422DRAFT_172840, partial [Sphaerobolus stellatus SS14]
VEERILTLCSGALSNIVREVELFKKTASENHLDIMTSPRHDLTVEDGLTGAVTKAYTDFMVATAATGSLLEGLVLLWATEKCYLEAWSYARSQIPSGSAPSTESGKTRALETFIHNWTTSEFRLFVEEIEALVDEYAKKFSGEQYEDAKNKAAEVWKWCLWYEERFWDGE